MIELSPKSLILINKLQPGDVLAMTAAVYSLHRAHPGRYLTAVDTNCNAIYENNPDTISLDSAREMQAEPWQTHYPGINQCNERGIHFMQAYCEYFEQELGIRIPLATNRPHVYLTDQEKVWINQVAEITGRHVKYWIVCSGVKSDYTCKLWNGYQEVIDRLQGRIVFVQVGKSAPSHLHPPLRWVINLVGKTDDRQLMRLVYHASGVLCGTTFLMHLAAAFEKPSVILAGGREPRQWNQYPFSTVLSTVGYLPCCAKKSCWKSRTVPLGDGDPKDHDLCESPVFTDPPSPRCMAIIQPQEVVEKILQIQMICS